MNDKEKLDYLRYKLRWWKAKLSAERDAARKESRNLQRRLDNANRQIMRVRKLAGKLCPR